MCCHFIIGTCLPDQTSCGLDDYECFDKSQKCDGKWDCPLKGADERDCGICIFGNGRFMCGKGATLCYHREERCDGHSYCPNFEDELYCCKCTIYLDPHCKNTVFEFHGINFYYCSELKHIVCLFY